MSLNTSTVLDIVKEITIAQIAISPSITTDAGSAEDVAAFMQVIYDKVIELETKHREAKQSNQ